MIEATRSNPDHADFESLMASIQIACKTIANIVSRAGISDLSDNQSPSALTQSTYDAADTVLKNALRFTGKLGVIAAEEDDHPLLVEEAWNSKYIGVFDPLDGSTNIDVGIVTGTIFGIFKEAEECLLDFGENVSEAGKKRLIDTLKPGKNLVAAGYCMYSSSTIMMISLGDGK
jgi:fructose-1,6-bisphosphatase I